MSLGTMRFDYFHRRFRKRRLCCISTSQHHEVKHGEPRRRMTTTNPDANAMDMDMAEEDCLHTPTPSPPRILQPQFAWVRHGNSLVSCCHRRVRRPADSQRAGRARIGQGGCNCSCCIIQCWCEYLSILHITTSTTANDYHQQR